MQYKFRGKRIKNKEWAYGLTPETIDEILVVFEKRTPKKVSDETFDSFTYGYCPICRTYLADDETYCPSCGQALKWGE